MPEFLPAHTQQARLLEEQAQAHQRNLEIKTCLERLKQRKRPAADQGKDVSQVSGVICAHADQLL